jgi:hypothetical protein
LLPNGEVQILDKQLSKQFDTVGNATEEQNRDKLIIIMLQNCAMRVKEKQENKLH